MARPSPNKSGTEAAPARGALRRFWRSARSFWRRAPAWSLIALLVACVVLQLLVQYRLNFWNRDFFNALEARNGGQIWQQAQLLALLAGAMPIGGMAAQMQNPRAPENDSKALRDIWFDKLRERLGEREVVALHHKGEDVAPLPAAEALPRFAPRGDDERGGLLAMEGAEPLQGRTSLAQHHRLADDVGHGESTLDLGDAA